MSVDLDAIRGAGRDERGRFEHGNQAALTHGQRAERLLNVPAMAEAHREREAAIVADLGGRGELSGVKASLVSQLAAVQLMTESKCAELFEKGLTTSAGRTRQAYVIYLGLLDRQMKLSALLGLERIASKVPDLRSYLAERERS